MGGNHNSRLEPTRRQLTDHRAPRAATRGSRARRWAVGGNKRALSEPGASHTTAGGRQLLTLVGFFGARNVLNC